LDPEVQEMLRVQAKALNAALLRPLIDKAAGHGLREANIHNQEDLDRALPEFIAALKGSLETLEFPVTTVRLSQMLCELVVVTADLLDEVDPASVVTTFDALLPVLLGQSVQPALAKAMFALHGETVAAVLSRGWTKPLVDVADFRDAGWGLLIGNAVAGAILGNGWKRRSDLAENIADNVIARLAEPPTDAPLPAETLFLPRRHPLRWTAAGVRVRKELEAESVRRRVEATAACLPRLLEAALADRLQDQLLNGEVPRTDVVDVPPVLGIAIIEMAARATAQRGELQPGAEVDAAAQMASRLTGFEPSAAKEAATRWATLWRAVLDQYEGVGTPGLPEGDSYMALSFAQTRGRKLAQFLEGNRGSDDGEPLAPPDIEVRAFARLFRFVQLRGSDLPSLPKLGTWPAPDPQVAEAALLVRFASAQMSPSLIEAWKDTTGRFRGRLQAFFAQLDRLLPYPEVIDAQHIDMAAEHWKVDRAAALEKLSVSLALEDEPWLIFLSVLCLRAFGDLAPSPADCFSLVKLAAERTHGSRADLLKLMSRNDWLAGDHAVAGELFSRAQALLAAGGAPAEPKTLQPLAELAASLAGVVRGKTPALPSAEHAVRKLLLITPESLRNTTVH